MKQYDISIKTNNQQGLVLLFLNETDFEKFKEGFCSDISEKIKI